MKKITVFMLFLMLSILSINLLAQKKGKPSGDTAVSSTIQDADSNSNPYSIQSDMLGSYQNGIDSVESIIQGISDWELNMSNSPTRQTTFDFGLVIPNTNIDNIAPPNSGAYPTRFLAQCSARGNKLQNLKLGDPPIYCPVNAHITVGSEAYSVRFRNVEFPGTDDVAWTCTSSVDGTNTGQCNGWRMESAPGGSIARLLKLTTVRGKITTKSGSLFYFTFKVDLTAP